MRRFRPPFVLPILVPTDALTAIGDYFARVKNPSDPPLANIFRWL